MCKSGETEVSALKIRWTARRKAAVLEALQTGALTQEDAIDRYALSVDEIRSWERQLERYGLPGLRVSGRQKEMPRVARRGRRRTTGASKPRPVT